MLNGPQGTRPQAQPAQVSGPPVSTVSPPQIGPMAGALTNPYFPYLNMPLHPFLWYGQAPIYNPQFPLLHPHQYMIPPMTSVPPTQPQAVEYPMIADWLALCDLHPQRSSENFSCLGTKFDQEGFQHLHQLTGEHITVEKLSEWLDIGKGTADLLLRYAEEDTAAIHAGAFQMLHGQNLIQPQT